MNHIPPKSSDTAVVARNENEAVFWDSQADRTRTFRSRFYLQVNDVLWREMLKLVGDLKGKKVLFVGCGTAAVSTRDLAQLGAEVWCLDISPRSIERLMEFPFGPERRRIHPIVASAEDTRFADNAFDVIIGKAIVHHLNIPAFISEMKRVCKPDARMIFSEPLEGNPAISLFRRITPSIRVDSEHPLRRRDLSYIDDTCGKTHRRYLFLFSLAAVPLFYVSLNRLATVFFRAGNAVDRFLFRVLLPLRLLAWNVTFRCDLKKQEPA